MRRGLLAMVVLAGSIASWAGTAAAETPRSSVPSYAKERADRAKHLTEPYGWFSLVALEWLKPGVTTVGSAKDNNVVLPGTAAHLLALEQRGGKVAISSASPFLTYRGQPVRVAELKPLVSTDEDDASALASGSLRMWAIDRGGRRSLRVKDANAPALKHFHGLQWYAPATQFRVEAKWIPYTTPHTLKVMNKLGQVTPTAVPGFAEFELEGKKHTLVPIDADEKGLWFVFRDETYRQTTDGGGRFLITKAPTNGLTKAGTVELDFNEAVNPPCAYSPFATCPLASPENRLQVSVTAGEKRYQE